MELLAHMTLGLTQEPGLGCDVATWASGPSSFQLGSQDSDRAEWLLDPGGLTRQAGGSTGLHGSRLFCPASEIMPSHLRSVLTHRAETKPNWVSRACFLFTEEMEQRKRHDQESNGKIQKVGSSTEPRISSVRVTNGVTRGERKGCPTIRGSGETQQLNVNALAPDYTNQFFKNAF